MNTIIIIMKWQEKVFRQTQKGNNMEKKCKEQRNVESTWNGIV